MARRPKRKPSPRLATKNGTRPAPEPDPNVVSSASLANVLGVTDRWLRQMADEGYLAKAGHGKYRLAESVQGYIRRIRETEVKPAADTPQKSDYDFERARKLKLENDQTENLLVPVADAVAAVDKIAGKVRTTLAGIPARVSPDDVALRRRVETQIDAALGELADDLEKVGRALETGRDPLAPDKEDDA